MRSPKRLVSPSTQIASSPADARGGTGMDASARSSAIAATCCGVRSTGSRATTGAASTAAESATSGRSPESRQPTAV